MKLYSTLLTTKIKYVRFRKLDMLFNNSANGCKTAGIFSSIVWKQYVLLNKEYDYN